MSMLALVVDVDHAAVAVFVTGYVAAAAKYAVALLDIGYDLGVNESPALEYGMVVYRSNRLHLPMW